MGRAKPGDIECFTSTQGRATPRHTSAGSAPAARPRRAASLLRLSFFRERARVAQSMRRATAVSVTRQNLRPNLRTTLALHHGSTGLHPEAFFAYTCFPAGLRPTSTCAQRSSPVMRPLALVGILVVAGASALINPWLLPRLRASYYPLGPATVRVLPRLLRRRSSPPSQMRFLLMKSKRAGAQHLHHERL